MKTIKHLLLTIEVKGLPYESARRVAIDTRFKLGLRQVDCASITKCRQLGELVYAFDIFDFYILEQLSFFQLLHHYIRKGYTAALRYIGINARVVVVVVDTGLSFVNGAHKAFNDGAGFPLGIN